MTRLYVIVLVAYFHLTSVDALKKVSENDGKIIGGAETDISRVPYQASLQVRYQHICGASILDATHLLTAAHCVESYNSWDMNIRVGTNTRGFGGQVYWVRKVTSHPSYSRTSSEHDIAVIEVKSPILMTSKTKIMPWKNRVREKKFNNDIAVLELKTPLQFSSTVKPIELAKSEPRAGEPVVVSGWGAAVEGGTSTKYLKSVTVSAIARSLCQRMYAKFNRITSNMWCAGDYRGGKDGCKGDSGGPAVVNGKLAGVVSWGIGCGRRSAPGVYTSVPKYLNWIKQQLS